MNTLVIENNYSWLTSSDEVKAVLWKLLRFRGRGYYHNVRYRMKLWDGYTEFFKKDSGKFLTGLLPEVKETLKHLKVEYKIDDKRKEFNFLYDKIDENLLENVTLRDYQVNYINQVIKNKRGIIPSATGSGKTLSLVGIVKSLPPNTPTLILANKKQLVEQNYDEMVKYGVVNVGRFYGEVKEPNVITCSTVQSAHLLPNLSRIKVLVVDEIHEMMSKKPKQIYGKLKECSVRVGMSATAYKFGGSDKTQKYEVKGWIGPEFAKLTTKQLQERNILASAECSFFYVNEPKLSYEIYLDAVTKGIAENELFHDTVTRLASRLEGRTLIIVERIEHGDRLLSRMPDALWVKGQDTMETRKDIIKRLKTEQKDLVAIATSGIFNTGIDVFIHNLVNAAGGQADHQIIQRFGRGLRVAGDKDHLKYYDFMFTNNEYLEKHSRKRIKVLQKEGHQVSVMEFRE